ncbi:hypothetical protein V6N13_019891 [Hibiscus sabdariffa]
MQGVRRIEATSSKGTHPTSNYKSSHMFPLDRSKHQIVKIVDDSYPLIPVVAIVGANSKDGHEAIWSNESIACGPSFYHLYIHGFKDIYVECSRLRSSQFKRVARQYIRGNKPDIICFMEPLISMSTPDKAIDALNIPNSFRVEVD